MFLPEKINKDTLSKLDFSKMASQAEDCKILDQQILEIQQAIDEVAKARLKKYGDWIAQQIVDLMLKGIHNQLKKLLQLKQNTYALGDCRNKTELVRQEETAAVFSETSAKQETQVLTQSKSKQYLLIGVGSILLVTTLVVVLIKRK